MKRYLAAAALLVFFACAKKEEPPGSGASSAGDTSTAPAEIDAEILASGLNFPWSMAFLPGGDMLIVEKAGGLRIFRNGALLPNPVPGLPTDVLVNSDSGLHDIAPDPDFEQNRRVFIAYAEGEDDANHLAIWRARIEGARLVGGEKIFQTSPDKAGYSHPGGRIAFLADKTFLVSVGDGYDYRGEAQNLSSYLGKILRLDRNGKPPADNPFIGRGDARPEIWSYGHRNPQGLVVDSETGAVWEHEHGPRGGDEINRLVAGANYGWPLTTNGIDYDGTLVSEHAHAAGIASPLIIWAPSIAPSGLAVYRGAEFPDWNGQFLIGALAAKRLVRAQLINDGRTISEAARLLENIDARIRDVRVGPDGLVYVLTDEADGRLIRLRPLTLPPNGASPQN